MHRIVNSKSWIESWVEWIVTSLNHSFYFQFKEKATSYLPPYWAKHLRCNSAGWPAGGRWWCGSPLCLPPWRCWIWASGGWGAASPPALWPSGGGRWDPPAPDWDAAPRSSDWACEPQTARSLKHTHTHTHTHVNPLKEQRERPLHLSVLRSPVNCCCETCVHGERGCCGVSFSLTSRAFQSAASCSILLYKHTCTILNLLQLSTQPYFSV